MLRLARRPRTGPATTALVAMLALVAAGCGGDGNGDDPASVSPESGPLFPDSFKTVCAGAPQSRATAYDPAAAEHKALYFGTYGEGLLEQSTVLPADWTVSFQPDGDALTAVDLVLCAERTAAVESRMCDGYEDDGEPTGNRVRLHHATWHVSVRSATTGQALAEETVEAQATTCPMITSFDGTDQTKDEYARIPDERLAAILRPHMEPGR